MKIEITKRRKVSLLLP